MRGPEMPHRWAAGPPTATATWLQRPDLVAKRRPQRKSFQQDNLATRVCVVTESVVAAWRTNASPPRPSRASVAGSGVATKLSKLNPIPAPNRPIPTRGKHHLMVGDAREHLRRPVYREWLAKFVTHER